VKGLDTNVIPPETRFLRSPVTNQQFLITERLTVGGGKAFGHII
jgi:hypothetical protein